MPKNNIYKTIIDYTIVSLIIIFSGANYLVSGYINDFYELFIYIIIAFIIYLFNKKIVDKRSTMTAFIIVSWYLINQLFFHTDYDNTYLKYISFVIGTYFLISCITEEHFQRRLLRIMQWLSFFSIIIHFLYWSGSISATRFLDKWDICLGVFNVGWGDNRLSSIFWEPGQYQVILNFTFVLCSSNIIYLIKNKLYSTLVKRYIILVIALLMTVSTTGYIAFSILCLLIAYSFLNSKNVFLSIFIMIISGLSVYYIYNSDAIQDKFAQRNERGNTSYSIRMADNIACLNMMKNEPLVGYGINTSSFIQESYSLDNTTSSNGWLKCGAQMGVVFLLYYLFSIWKGLKNKKIVWAPSISFFIILLSQAGEPEYQYPLVLLLILSFGKEFKQGKNIYKYKIVHEESINKCSNPMLK